MEEEIIVAKGLTRIFNKSLVAVDHVDFIVRKGEILDEPTLGLDVQTRTATWGYIRRLKKEFGMTLFMTTHYLEEADNLCDRIAIIDNGKIIVIDTPETLKENLGGDIIILTIEKKGPNITSLIETVSRVKAVKNTDDKSIMNLLNLPLLFGSNALFSTEMMPGWLQTFAKINPIAYVTDAARQLVLFSTDNAQLMFDFAFLAGFVLIFSTIGLLLSWRYLSLKSKKKSNKSISIYA